MTNIVTRFAPSPTGMLHIGGVRTALVNWLFARHHQGKYLVRIEDTDRKRSTPEAITAIEQGLDWLGLASDMGVTYQSTRLARHTEVAEQLIKQGKAYRCQCSPEDLDEMRQKARESGQTRMYDRRCRDLDLTDSATTVVRLKAPTTGTTQIKDIIQGEITIENDHLDDYILLRADNTPTYMLSCVVDDADMGVTHIIRGDDHINNAFRQLQLIRAAGFNEPHYAHLSLLHGDDGAKLSKRHGALGIAHYKDSGYLPEAILNYLMRLGWGKGLEFIALNDATEIFNLAEMSKSPARIDFERLDYFNAHYLRKTASEDPLALIKKCSEFSHQTWTDHQLAILKRGIHALAERAETLNGLSAILPLYSNAPTWPIDDSKAEKQFRNKAPKANLALLSERTGHWNFNSPSDLKDAVAQYVADMDVGFGIVGQPLRIALCGTMQAPDIGDILFALGQNETQQRLDNALTYLNSCDN